MSELTYNNVQVLLVNLVNFSGKATSTGNVLNWRTTAEQNNSGFEVLRSRIGADFEKIGFRKSLAINGNSDTPLGYSFSDVTNDVDVYYKLNQLDINGKATASQTIVVKARFATENQVYPNPATNSFNVSTSDGGAKITVTTLEGRVIRTIIATGKVTTIDSSNWSSGMYIIEVQSASGTTVKKVVIYK